MADKHTNAHSSEDINPYRSPVVENSVAIPPITDAELTRRLHLNHESSVKAIGGLFLLAAISMLLVAVVSTIRVWASGAPIVMLLGGATLLSPFLVVLFGVTGVGVRLLRPWGRVLCAGICTGSILIGLISPGLRLLVPAYVLYLLFCKKGRMVFSAEYQQIIRDTPHVKPRTSIVAWLVLAVFLIGLVALLSYIAMPRYM